MPKLGGTDRAAATRARNGWVCSVCRAPNYEFATHNRVLHAGTAALVPRGKETHPYVAKVLRDGYDTGQCQRCGRRASRHLEVQCPT